MAVVVDQDFYRNLAPMRPVPDMSNCDIVWFVVKFDEDDTSARARLAQDAALFTTLESAVEGLTAGIPVSQEEFERRILRKVRTGADPREAAS